MAEMGIGSPRRALVALRAVMLGLVLAIALLAGRFSDLALALGCLTGLAVVATLLTARPARPWEPFAEAFLASLVIGLTQPDAAVLLLPYLLVPSVEAGLLFGTAATLATTGTSAATLAAAGLGTRDDNLLTFLTGAIQWMVICGVAGLLAAWVRRMRLAEAAPSTAESYAAANRLLAQLRTVSRRLSGGLDAYSLAQATLESLRENVHFTRGGVFVRSEGGLLVPLALGGVGRVDWAPSLEGRSPWREAWTTGQPHRRTGTFSAGPGGYSLVVPMRAGTRVIGLVGLERTEAPFTREQIAAAAETVDASALPIETALLFDEVRQIATAEERRRLAREIHDGIAQELASLGYLVDDMAYRSDDEEAHAALQGVRRELTRIISELRLSIFDLRSEVRPGTGIGAAISDYVRQVGATSDLTVHLELDEGPSRLRTEDEAELMRIAQEAVTNVRKHAGAQHLWVTLRTDPPNAYLMIMDDGLGLGTGRADSYGMDIMRERAARVGARLSVGSRPDGGTVVEVVLDNGVQPQPQPSTAPPGSSPAALTSRSTD